jgi:hypothetical protein
MFNLLPKRAATALAAATAFIAVSQEVNAYPNYSLGDNVTLSTQAGKDVFGNNLTETLGINIGIATSVRAGIFQVLSSNITKGTLNELVNMICDDLYRAFPSTFSNLPYTITNVQAPVGAPVPFTAQALQSINTLFANHFDSAVAAAPTNAAISAGFQAVAWELLYDPTDFNLNTGTFIATGGSAAMNAYASGVLTAIENGTALPSATLAVLQATSGNGKQNQLVFDKIPEPATAVLVGLGAIALAVRRRQPKAKAAAPV